ncbi:MAG: peptidylprolyl isomerase [Bacteroidales bacterium]|nr:peptidylprolyl isomerase [Bacteroidales bacterium]
MKSLVYSLSFVLALASCSPEPKKPAAKPAPVNHYAENLASMARLILYDEYGDRRGECSATYVDSCVVAAPLSLVRGSTTVHLTPLNSNAAFSVSGFVAFDFKSDMVLLSTPHKPTALSPLAVSPVPADSLFSLVSTNGKVFKKSFSVAVDSSRQVTSSDSPSSTTRVRAGLDLVGHGAFSRDGFLHGVVNSRCEVVPSSSLASLIASADSVPSPVHILRLKSDKVYPKASSLAGFEFRTSLGSFRLALYDDVPVFRDNFIRLATDGYYDSLLFHRVMPNFLVQTGAADSRHAAKDDPVGWDGPGYTLPTVPTPNHLHVAGAIAASKPPESKNPRNRSDAGQFYVIVGRKYSDKELDKLAKDYGKSFSATQRRLYSSVGGAPHLDGDYVVFAHITSGMDVIKKIAALPLDGERPLQDVRILAVKPIKK